MADFQTGSARVRIDSAGFNASVTTANGFSCGNDAKGSWNELIASTSGDCDLLFLYVYHSDSGVEEFLFDVAVGAAGSEEAIIENVHLTGRPRNDPPLLLNIPVHIAAGSRVSVRCQGTTVRTVNVAVKLYANSFSASPSRAGAKGFGIDLSGSRGTVVDPGGVANTLGAWTEIDASTSDDIYGFFVMIGNDDNATINTNNEFFIDIGIGGAGSEEVVVDSIWSRSSTSENNYPTEFFDIVIPAGTRIAARMQAQDIDATDRIKTIALLGIV